MIGYGISLRIIKTLKNIPPVKKTSKKFSVTVMIVAHNEEKVIEEKLKNVIDNDYPTEKIKYLVASDNSTDATDKIVQEFILKHQNIPIALYRSKEHKGKTNAQNEAQKLVDTEILVMTDANSMFQRDSISQLISSFADDDIAYVCGALLYTNTSNIIANYESNYWIKDLKMRLIESHIKTITAGNGAIYACRNNDYVEIPPIECHDSSMPYYYAMHFKRAIFNEKAVAFEKAGENLEDEFKRKVRMNRGILMNLSKGIAVLNIFKYKWFSYFYFGHRTSRYLLWLSHLLLFVSNFILMLLAHGAWLYLFLLQVFFYFMGFIGKYAKTRVLCMTHYYCMTILAQYYGVINIITGKAKPTWDSASSTR